jgi:hypothetical protein
MAVSIEFDGINRRYETPPENPDEDRIALSPPMFGYSNGILAFTRWKLSPEELTEIAKTGEVWLAVRCGRRPMQPHWLGSLSHIKQACADFGGLWRPKSATKLLEDKRDGDDLEPA